MLRLIALAWNIARLYTQQIYSRATSLQYCFLKSVRIYIFYIYSLYIFYIYSFYIFYIYSFYILHIYSVVYIQTKNLYKHRATVYINLIYFDIFPTHEVSSTMYRKLFSRYNSSILIELIKMIKDRNVRIEEFWFQEAGSKVNFSLEY